MPNHHFICRQCGSKKILSAPVGRSPQHPYCQTCHRTYAKVFGFGFTPIPIEISGPGGKFGSQRAYNTDRTRRSDIDSERVGREVNYESFDPRDTDQDPTKPLK